MLKVVCVDDEKQSLQHLASLCRNIPEIAAVNSFGKSGEALAWIESHPCDLILLEISMPEPEEVWEALNEDNKVSLYTNVRGEVKIFNKYQ